MPPFAQIPGSPGVAVRWEVAHDDKFTRIAQSGQSLALQGLAYQASIQVKIAKRASMCVFQVRRSMSLHSSARKEAFYHGVVRGIADRAHARPDTHVLAAFAKRHAGVLGAFN